MAVVGVAHMGVGMFQFLVAVLMGVPEGAVGRLPLQILRSVSVLMVGVAAAGIVAVAMGMQERFMAMQVAVLLTQQQRHARGHQSRRQQQGR